MAYDTVHTECDDTRYYDSDSKNLQRRRRRRRRRPCGLWRTTQSTQKFHIFGEAMRNIENMKEVHMYVSIETYKDLMTEKGKKTWAEYLTDKMSDLKTETTKKAINDYYAEMMRTLPDYLYGIMSAQRIVSLKALEIDPVKRELLIERLIELASQIKQSTGQIKIEDQIEQ